MANEQNLRPGEYKFTQEDAKKGQQNSAKARREKKTVQRILDELLERSVSDMPQVTKLAAKLGIESDKSVKELVSAIALLNTIKTANLGDLEKISKLLGEQTEIADTEAQKQADFLAAVKKAVTDGD